MSSAIISTLKALYYLLLVLYWVLMDLLVVLYLVLIDLLENLYHSLASLHHHLKSLMILYLQRLQLLLMVVTHNTLYLQHLYYNLLLLPVLLALVD